MTNGAAPQRVLLREQKNSKHQGDVGLAIAIGWFVANHYRVAIPLTDSQDYDLVIETEGKFYSVQVKTTYFKVPETGNYHLSLKVSGGNRSGTGKIKTFDPSRVDFIFGVTEMGDKYLIPSSAISARHAISLCDKWAQYKVE